MPEGLTGDVEGPEGLEELDLEDLEDLGSETDKRGSEDQPSEAKSAPVVFFCEAGESTSLVCPEFELSFCWSNRCRRI